jgi:hypothetical protein
MKFFRKSEPVLYGYDKQDWATFAISAKEKRKKTSDWLGDFLAIVIMIIVASVLRSAKDQPPCISEFLLSTNLAVLFCGIPLVALLLEFNLWKTLLLFMIGILVILF